MIIFLQRIPEASLDARALETLSAPQRERLSAISHPARKRQHLWSRTLFNAFAATLGVAAPDEFPRDRAHPPTRGRFTTLSHTGDWVMLGAAETPVAVDVEPMRPRENWRALAEYAFSTEKVEAVAAAPAPLTAFYAAWVEYECRIKYPKAEDLDRAYPEPRMRTMTHGAAPFDLMIGALSADEPRLLTGEALLDALPLMARILR